jgi:hypothetical protein
VSALIVVERNNEVETGVAPGQFFSLVQQGADVRLQPVAFADHSHPHAVAVQGGKVVADEAAKQAEQIADFGCRT